MCNNNVKKILNKYTLQNIHILTISQQVYKFTFLVRIFKAKLLADSRSRRFLMGGIRSPGPPYTRRNRNRMTTSTNECRILETVLMYFCTRLLLPIFTVFFLSLFLMLIALSSFIKNKSIYHTQQQMSIITDLF